MAKQDRRQLIQSLSKDRGDFVMETFSGTGAGGHCPNYERVE